ncbi:MAG: hypothetical protein HYU59_09200 [Magnetospirillum gryphiswaldense]|nr:hypothetical protein [Magnetospirillum gryphiswaldense]
MNDRDRDRDLDLNATMALTQRLLNGSDGASASGDKPADADKSAKLGQNLRYWMWRAGGRKRNVKDTAHVSRLLDNYEIELERLHETHGRAMAEQKQAHDRMVQEIEGAHQRSAAGLRAEFMAEAEAEMARMRDEVERKRQRVEQLEKLVDDFQRVYQVELVKARHAGRDEIQPDLDAARARIAQLEGDMAFAQQAHADELRDRVNEEAERGQLALSELQDRLQQQTAEAEADLRAELDQTRQQAEAELLRLREELTAEAATSLDILNQRLDRLEADKQAALEAAAQTHQAELAALRVRHAEELAETRTNGEWSLSDARRQITDLKLRLTELEETHAEDVDALRQQHKVELAQWLERFEQAQAHQEIRHAGEYAGAQHSLTKELEDARARLETLQLELVGERAARKEKDDELAALLGELALSQGQVSDLEEALEAERRQAGAEAVAQARARVAMLEAELKQTAETFADEAADVQSLRDAVQAAEDRVAALENELQETASRLAVAEADLTAEREARAASDASQKTRDELKQTQARLMEAEKELVARSQDLTTLQTELADLRHQAEQSRVEARTERAKAQELQAAQAASEALLEGGRQELDLARQQLEALSLVRDQAVLAEQERQAQARLQAQWRQELEAARDAARMAGEVAEKLKSEMADERHKAETARPSPPQDTDFARQAEEQRLELARLRLDSSRRIADLERQLEQRRKESVAGGMPAPTAEPPAVGVDKPPPRPEVDWQARAEALLQRAERAEAEVNLSVNKIEVLKDALAVAKARPGTNAALNAAIDTRFRDAKRAFARAFHPDQGGRDNPDKSALFLEFWPILEKIGKEDD